MSDDIRALKFEGGVDADGHILEDKNLWENYLEAKYKPKALRLKRDRAGLEYMEIEGRPSKFLSGGMFAGLSAMGNTREMARNSADYGGMAPLGAMDPGERLKRIEQENLKAAFLYPTLSLLYEVETIDPEMAQAYTRAYNRYIVDFCKGSGGKLLPVAHLSLGDPQAAANELERAVKDGCKGAWVC
jgi:predicted TIM-barrel fold metal-dependent hydrolase